ncbi:MAG: inositol monophosphatase family protein [Oscillospiraceae bacterium]|nr:inositol monophosphatase family protein [Oscillospiraceae bacterium]
MDLSKLLKKVIEITKAASQFTKSDFIITEKESHINFVTSADIAVQRFLEEKLVALLPDSAFFGEEGNKSVKTAEYLWVVDPIDGTVNFSRGNDECAISVGLVHKEQVVLGVIYAPFKGELYYASLGSGAFFNGKPIKASERSFKNSLFCTALCLYKKEYTEKCIDIMREVYSRCVDIRRSGSCALDMCYLAKGECELFFEFRVFPWDCAAGIIILNEAGGIITGLDGASIKLDRASPLIAANNAENHKMLLEIVKKHIKTMPYEEILR